MAAVVPITGTVTGTSTITVGPYRQLLVKNLDTSTTLQLSWNGSAGTYPLEPRERLGMALSGTIITFTVTCPGAQQWAYLLQG